MPNILALGASSSKQSINRKLANYAANLIEEAEVDLIDLNNYEMPIYSIDREQADGIPVLAEAFKQAIDKADAIVISFAEHNGSYTAAFKNILDWVSRIDGPLWSNKPMLLLSTSPGGRGGLTVLNAAAASFGYLGAELIGQMALPKFNENFSEETGLLDEEMKLTLTQLIKKLDSVLAS